ncbi:SUMO-conjugating enzyme ubc9 [Podospora aff. communis PSN243]|uniref:SUMO-conjugating enzyme ubc9 n=1 Tax=Podospora aff. communis PSN243 TaxID=3040156 RepID=A0AAV9GMR0_9PEZI|nr:SUMO-conjugating enzyme ubc9 [Podospora aff. communis PSN243]
MASDLKRRLMQDIAELKKKPYPNIKIHFDDDDVTEACLVITPEGWPALHMTIEFPPDYPLKAPKISMNSHVVHPNVFGYYICASILNTAEGYTPAYTLKGIVIQILSFFCSDSIEQGYDDVKVPLGRYREESNRMASLDGPQRYLPPASSTTFGDGVICNRCRFNRGSSPAKQPADDARGAVFRFSRPRRRKAKGSNAGERCSTETDPNRFFIDRLPNEIILQIAERLEFEELTKFAAAWGRVSQLITQFDVIRLRELQCFVLKENHLKQKLGVGVDVVGKGRQGTLQSEFDLLSHTAFANHKVRNSIHNIPFQHWLPLPISHGHWERVRAQAEMSLARIAQDARISSSTMVLYAFMNDVIVRLNADLEPKGDNCDCHAHKSTLRHASEKAIESYFHLFHLLLCIATAKPEVVREANQMIASFMAGKRSKADIPNLGYLLIALLISDTDPTEALMKEIITEAITRNVVWLLDQKGAGMAELGYLETDDVCNYRLKKTFEGSRTSYRLLMFSELFRRTARPSPPRRKPTTHATPPPSPPASGKKPLAQLRDDLFRRHGGAGPGAAAHLASEVRRLQKIDDFPNFLREMGITLPGAAKFTTVLRGTIKASAEKGYSQPVGKYVHHLAALRLARDSSANRTAIEADLFKRQLELPALWQARSEYENGRLRFFPGGPTPAGRGQGPSRGGRGGRGGWRG